MSTEMSDHGLMITEEDGMIIFRATEEESQTLSRSKIAEGVDVMTNTHFSTIREVVFDGTMFSREEAETFLREELGFEPSDNGRFMFSEPGEAVLLAETMHEDENFKFAEVDVDGIRMLSVSATALTAGDWAGHHFPLAVVQECVDRLHRVPVCVEHKFTDPGDVKGLVTKQFVFNHGIKVDFLVHDELTINQILSGDKGAVSMNFIAATDRDKNITKIRKVFEFTVCKHPRCADAVIESSRELTVNFNRGFSAFSGENGEKDSPASPEAHIGGQMTDESKDNASLQLAEEKADDLAKKLEEITVQLAEKEAKLSEQESNLTLAQKENDDRDKKLADLETNLRLRDAKDDVGTFIKTMKFTKASESNLVDFYVTLSAEQQKAFGKVVEDLPKQVELGLPGDSVPAEGRPANETVAEQTDDVNDKDQQMKMAKDLNKVVNSFRSQVEGQRAMTPDGRVRGGR